MKTIFIILAMIIGSGAYAQQLQPKLAADINPGYQSSSPYMLTPYNGQLYFAANNGINGYELYRFNGSAASLVYDLAPGTDQGIVVNIGYQMGTLNGKLYFAGSSPSVINGCFEYSGSGAPIESTAIDSAGQGSNPFGFCTYGGKMYFAAYRAKWGIELFVYDGVNPVKIVDINSTAANASSTPYGLLPYNGKIYFSADNGTAGRELYAYDTLSGTAALVKDIYTGSGSSNPVVSLLANNKLYFTARDSATGGELYSYDGTTVSRLTDLTPGKGSGLISSRVFISNTFSRSLGYLNGNIYFSGATDSIHYYLYQYNIAGGSTTLLKQIGGGGGVELNGKLYFPAADAGSNALQMWMTDGTTTSKLADINRYGSSAIRELCVWNGVLYFQASDSTHGGELFRLAQPSGIAPVLRPAIAAAYPNPTDGDAQLSLSLRSAGLYDMDVIDATGRPVWSARRQLPEGSSNVDIPTGRLPAGQYFYRLFDAQHALNAGGSLIRR